MVTMQKFITEILWSRYSAALTVIIKHVINTWFLWIFILHHNCRIYHGLLMANISCHHKLLNCGLVMHQITWLTLVQVMAWCLMAPSHYLDQCWLIIKGVLWHSPECNFTRSAWESMHSANERWRYNVTSSLIGLVHTQNDLYIPYRPVSWYIPLLSLLFCPYRVKNGGSFRQWNKMCYWPFWYRGFTMCVNSTWPYATYHHGFGSILDKIWLIATN